MEEIVKIVNNWQETSYVTGDNTGIYEGNGLGRCWCDGDETTGGHTHHPGVQDYIDVQTSANCMSGFHQWLPWLQLSNGDWVTRCLNCRREERWEE
jgi:hypothetical protein